MVSFKQAFRILFSQSIPLQTQKISLFEAQGKVLSNDITVLRNLPAFSNSAMDGYAISSIQSSYTMEGSIFAGDQVSAPISPSGCVKIMTGASIPPNTLAVIPFEHTQIHNKQIIPTLPIKEAQNIKHCGEDYQKGGLLLNKGTRLNYASLALLASQGISQIPIYKQPKIAIYASGNEIKEPWEMAQKHQVYNTNAITYHSLLQEQGFDSQYQGILPDDKDALIQRVQEFSQYDIVITSGGASVGEADFFEEALKENEAEILFHGINLKPGRPMLCAKLKNTLIFSLPGNPLSGALNLITLVLPTLHKLSGTKEYFLQSIQALHSEELKLKAGRTHIILGYFDGKFFTPFSKGKYGSGSLKPLQHSNSLIITEEEVAQIKANQEMSIILLPLSFSTIPQQIFNQLR